MRASEKLPIACRLCNAARRGECVQCPTARARSRRALRENWLLLVSFLFWVAGLAQWVLACVTTPAAAASHSASQHVVALQVDNGLAGGILTTLLGSILALMGWVVLTTVRNDDRGDDHDRRLEAIEKHLGFGTPKGS